VFEREREREREESVIVFMSSSGGSTSRWRVKMYHLNDDGQWSDKGTGFCSCSYVEQLSGFGICIESEENDRYFARFKVVEADVYQRQGDTIITWKEPTNGIDLALSFQEEEGCREIWNKISDLQGKVSVDFRSSSDINAQKMSEEEISRAKQQRKDKSTYGANGRADIADSEIHEDFEIFDSLPTPSHKNLDIIVDRIESAKSPSIKAQIAHVITSRAAEWLGALKSIFEQVEDLGNDAGVGDCKSASLVYRSVFAICELNDATLFEILMSDTFVGFIMGVFEHDPNRRSENHREYVLKRSSFQEIIPVDDQDVLGKIHETHRLEYLKDAILAPRAVNDMTIATINTLLHLNNCFIIMRLQGNQTFMRQLWATLLDENATRIMKRRGAIVVLHKMCHLAKNLQPEDREVFYRSLTSSGPSSFFAAVEKLLDTPQLGHQPRLQCVQILSCIVTHKPVLLHDFVVERESHPEQPPRGVSDAREAYRNFRQRKKRPRYSSRPPTNTAAKIVTGGNRSNGHAIVETKGSLSTVSTSHHSILWLIADMIVSDSDASMQAEAESVLLCVLNPDNMEASHKDKFLSLFYDHYIQWLFLPFVTTDTDSSTLDDGGGERNGASTPTKEICLRRRRLSDLEAAKHIIIEMLSYFVKAHGFRIKYYILRHNIAAKVIKVLHCRRKHVRLSAVRFLRACVSMKDEFYNKYLVKNDLLRPVFKTLRDNGDRDNMINSAICEFAEYVRVQKIDSLATYIVDSLSPFFQDISYVDTFVKLFSYCEDLRKEQAHHSEVTRRRSRALASTENERFRRMMDDESYFYGEDNDDSSLVPAAGVVVSGYISDGEGSGCAASTHSHITDAVADASVGLDGTDFRDSSMGSSSVFADDADSPKPSSSPRDTQGKRTSAAASSPNLEHASGPVLKKLRVAFG